MTVQNSVDYDSLDGNPVYLCFMIAAPQDDGNIHLQALAKLSTLLMNEDFRNELINAKSIEQFIEIIDQEEAKKEVQEKKITKKEEYRVLAVTACPTGIAHTFMVAENLTKAGGEMGYPLKAETNGADGAKNVLTAEEIKNCDGIIIAADKNVEMARFDGKSVLLVSVTQGIQKLRELIQKIIDHQVPVYHHDGSTVETIENSEGIGRSIYKHLMNGVSHMLPFVIGGGILIALAFLFDDYSIDPSNFGKNTPFAAYLKTIGEQAFGLMLPVLAGYISYSIAARPGLAVGFIGGMIPPLAIALSTTFFKNRWTEDERNSGLVNYVMGVAFISEGAIPFAAKDPLSVIPSCIVGSAVAGALSMFFGCTLRAPHGGIFVLPTIGNPLMYALAILIGAIVGCLVLSILKKPLKGN